MLARPDDALKTILKSRRRVPVETVEDGYELKAYQVGSKLQSFRISDDQVLFFNSAEDEPERLRAFLRGRMPKSAWVTAKRCGKS